MAGNSFDFTKEYKDLYLPSKTPGIIEVPPMTFLMVDGAGDPNEEGGEYSAAMEVLYGISWTIKMSHKTGAQPAGFYEYKVPPLEGLWWIDGFRFDGLAIQDKSKFKWISMIRQPEFVTPEVFEWAKNALVKKRGNIDFSHTHLARYDEGLCVQALHRGPYDDEPATIQAMINFVHEQGYVEDFSDAHDPFPLDRRHHEIYLGDPRKTKPENLRTVIRHPVKKA